MALSTWSAGVYVEWGLVLGRRKRGFVLTNTTNMYQTGVQRHPKNLLNRRIPKPSYRHAAPAGFVAPLLFRSSGA